ncbi:MAG: MFS transporter, partial [Micrococcus sp.]|nr:MFS transporter [Micrococcus sp.]
LFAGSAVSSALAGALAEAGEWTLLFGLATAVALLLTVVAATAMSRYQARN